MAGVVREELLLPPADYEDSQGDESVDGFGVLAEQPRHNNQSHSASRGVKAVPNNRKVAKPQNRGVQPDTDKYQTEDLRDLPMLDRFALQERERLEKIKQRRIEKIEQEKANNTHNLSINNGSVSVHAHNTSLMRHTRAKAPEEGRIKLEERARIMMEEKLIREEAERRKRAEVLKQQELEACTFKPKLNKSKRTNLAPRIPADFEDYQEKENHVDEDAIRRVVEHSNHKQKAAGSKSPARDQEKEDRVTEMMKWGQNRDKKVYERVIAEEAALAQMRGTKKLPLKDIERLGERMYAAQQAIEKKRKAQADHEFVSTCTFKPAINQKSLEIAQNKKRRPITEVPAHLVNVEQVKAVAKNRSKSPPTPTRPKTPRPPLKTGPIKSQSNRPGSVEKPSAAASKSKVADPPAIVQINDPSPDVSDIEQTQEEVVKMEGLESPPIQPTKRRENPKEKPVSRTKPVPQPAKTPKEPTKPKTKLDTSLERVKRPQLSKLVVAEIKCEPELPPPESEKRAIKKPQDEDARKQTLLEENLKKVKLALQGHSTDLKTEKIPKKLEYQEVSKPAVKPELQKPKLVESLVSRYPDSKPEPGQKTRVPEPNPKTSKVEYTQLQFMSNTAPDRHAITVESEDVDEDDHEEYISTIERMQRIESGQDNSYAMFPGDSACNPKAGEHHDRKPQVQIPHQEKSSNANKSKAVAQLNYRSLQGPAMVHPTTNHKSRESVRQVAVSTSDRNDSKKEIATVVDQPSRKFRQSDVPSRGVPIFASMPVSDGEFEEDSEEKQKEIKFSKELQGEIEGPTAEEILAAHVKKIASLVHRDKQRRELKAEIRLDPVVQKVEDDLFVPGRPIPQYVKGSSTEALPQRSNRSSQRIPASNESEEEPSPDFKGRETFEYGGDDAKNVREQVTAFQRSTQAREESPHHSDRSDQQYSKGPSEYGQRSGSISDPDREQESLGEGNLDDHDIEIADDSEPEIDVPDKQGGVVRQSQGRQHRYAEPSDGESEPGDEIVEDSRTVSHPHSEVHSSGEGHHYDEDELFDQPNNVKPGVKLQNEGTKDLELEDWERGDADDDGRSSSTSRSYSLEYNPPARKQQQDSTHSQVILESMQDTSSHFSRPLEESELSGKPSSNPNNSQPPPKLVQPAVDSQPQTAAQKKASSAAQMLAKMKMLCAELETNAHS